MYLINFKVLYV